MKWLTRSAEDALRKELPVSLQRELLTELHRDSLRRCYSSWRFWLSSGPVLLIAAGVASALRYLFPFEWFGQYAEAGRFTLYTATMIGGILLAMLCIQRVYRRCLWQALRERDFDVCLKCGYWLRGLGDDVQHCPECGAKREPMAQPRDALQ